MENFQGSTLKKSELGLYIGSLGKLINTIHFFIKMGIISWVQSAPLQLYPLQNLLHTYMAFEQSYLILMCKTGWSILSTVWIFNSWHIIMQDIQWYNHTHTYVHTCLHTHTHVCTHMISYTGFWRSTIVKSQCYWSIAYSSIVVNKLEAKKCFCYNLSIR